MANHLHDITFNISPII